MDENIRKKILALLDQHRIMTIATLRPDGWPQVTTVGYVNEGLTLYFLCGLDSQKAANLARDDRVSLTIDHDTSDIMTITGLSMAARAKAVTDRAEAAKVLRTLPLNIRSKKSPSPCQCPGRTMCEFSASRPRSFPCSTIRKALDTPISSPCELNQRRGG
jgi:nitroimidazol reductase NimA-like FMN-containing flavoprotein (pyridoxamine 5'-phosphate oxidase superfamily)